MQDIEELLKQLPSRDVQPEFAAYVRDRACAIIVRHHTLHGRLQERAGHLYGRILEPAAVAATVLITLSWALQRIQFIVR